MKIKSIYLLSLMALIISCDDNDEFENLNASLEVESKFIGTTEGNHLYFNLSLSKALSKSLKLKGTFNTDGISAYINDDDYRQVIEFSSDNGRNWKTEENRRIINFEAGTTSLKARIATFDDDKQETIEKFNLKLEVESSGIEISNAEDITLQFVLFDNEAEELLEPGLMTFNISDDGSYEIDKISHNISEPHQKVVIDGAYKELLDDVIAVTKLGPVGIKKFILLYENSGLGGFVYNKSITKGEDDFVMGLNATLAYKDRNSPDRILEYNENGSFGYVLAHEYGHVLTLSYKDQFYPEEDLTTCSFLSLLEGCAYENAYMNVFNDNFYLNPPTKDPFYVTDYASTNIAEDIAESFAFYIAQDNVPIGTVSSSTALQKINFILGENGLAPMREKIRELISVNLLSESPPIYEYQVGENGEYISCLDHHSLKKEFFE